MRARTGREQITLCYRTTDSATGVTRKTAKRLAELFGVDETQAIHVALRDMTVKLLPRYEPDDGPLTAVQMRKVKAIASQNNKRKVRSNLFDLNKK